ncbi:DUF1836 domain-containing protein [[Clostridium] polysaccharolyticum]|uniref:DUF1836 domain-containing protein n=1 Tax=[Clostridium] polysaccharolyticum TaxID=29364 RepID=A0A1I0EX88_9FIRM|nr:DUF1836 domain-containing protein [[Clostridium] polysaccharolyticum]SET50256.1 protein of unknown function [[Clostridium] polysaccharolyticum]
MTVKNEDYVRSLLRKMERVNYIKPSEVPDIDLYMDQVTTFMDEHLKSCKRYEDDKMLTKTMINNYTKNNLLPSPSKKKYSKEHMLLLIFIYYFKSFLSISDIQMIFEPLTERFYGKLDGISLEEIYKEVYRFERNQIDRYVKSVIRQYKDAEETFQNAENEEDREFLTTFSFICMLSFDVYCKKMMIEKIIDEQLAPMAAKREKREKEKEKK